MLCTKLISVALSAMLLFGTSATECASSPDSVKVPVLLYHHLTDEPGNQDNQMSAARFEEHISALTEAGYTGVSLADLKNYVELGMPLPEKPIVITFDDGYLSNYTEAYPILQKYNMKAVIFVIGVAHLGDRMERPTKEPSIPHFDFEQSREMIDSGLISIGSHTFDMHQWPPLEQGRARENMLKWSDESEEDYLSVLCKDFDIMNRLFTAELGKAPLALAYPGGRYNSKIENVATEYGLQMTFTSIIGMNTIKKGDAKSLRELKRNNISGEMSADELLKMISKLK